MSDIGSSLLLFSPSILRIRGFPDGSMVKNPPANTGDTGLITRLRRSPGGGNGSPLLYSCLENPMGRGAWLATAHGVAGSDTAERLNHHHVDDSQGC